MHPFDHRAFKALGAARRGRHQPFGAGNFLRARRISRMAKGDLARMDERFAVESMVAPVPGFGLEPLVIVERVEHAVEGRDGPQVTLGTRADVSWVRIVVLDNGVGIAAEQLKDIFKPFMSTKGSRGTGLGLPVSRKILREHGGDISVQSQPGVGTKFTLRLPVKSPLTQDLGATMGEVPVLPTTD